MSSARNELLVPLSIKHRGTVAGEGLKAWISWLEAIIRVEGSDLIVKSGLRPRVRHRGVLKDLETAICTPNIMMQVAMDILDPNQVNYFERHGSIDFAYDYKKAGDEDGTSSRRFRVNLFMARGNPSLAARLITSNIKRFEELYLPAILGDVSMAAQGLILFSGVTGSGKSTSIASMIDYVNQRKKVHIITIEDPIEYIFNDAKATINQREIGIDATNFNDALRALVRENPDVVLVGEMRDYETFEAAIRAAETGHLVFGTIHASSAWQTFGRIYDLFPEGERDQIRKLLGYNLRAIIYQKLLPTLHAHIARIPALEILINTPAVQKYILDGREGEILELIKQGHDEGMLDFTSALVKLVEDNMIHQRVALEATPKPEELKMRLKGIG
ncbi:MAG: PilT/PilU family type 4a pilus ATPase [Planctomycetota bacterium]|jgi:twitching motility protein PilT|nr:MAG: PilT/PilU family type 4a pilus ATPase [Planctomycetota bacterium]RLS87510.1 MAG: PilT/PilU family type 4a pilus ATPase [Planctomycetota bacterium]